MFVLVALLGSYRPSSETKFLQKHIIRKVQVVIGTAFHVLACWPYYFYCVQVTTVFATT